MRRSRLIAVLVVCALAFLLPLESAGTALAKAKSPYTTLKLRNGWTNAPYSTSKAQVRNVSGIVYFKGAMSTTGTNHVAFVLPRAFRPHTWVYVAVDMCNASNGRLAIQPNGTVSVEATDFTNAQCFTSLDGGSFALSGKSFTTLSPRNGWTNAPFSTSDVKARDIGGIVHFKGAMSTTGSNPVAFVLPRSLRPHTTVYVKVDLCDATNGRLQIVPKGTVTVQAEGANFGNAQCFTSLDGASFAVSGKSFTTLRLRNGWKNAPYSTSKAQVRDIGGIVYFKGAIGNGHSAVAFVLPRSFRPRTWVYIPVDMCGATNGRLNIQPSGRVSLVAESNFVNAQCFTSLDGAWFAQK